MSKVSLKEPDSALDMLTSNLNPIIAYEVQQCWIDPKAIRIGNLLGHGEYDTVDKVASLRLTKFRNRILGCFQCGNR